MNFHCHSSKHIHIHASTYSHPHTHPPQTTATPFVAEPCASCSPTRSIPQISPRLDPCASCPTKRSLHGTIRCGANDGTPPCRAAVYPSRCYPICCTYTSTIAVFPHALVSSSVSSSISSPAASTAQPRCLVLLTPTRVILPTHTHTLSQHAHKHARNHAHDTPIAASHAPLTPTVCPPPPTPRQHLTD